MVVFGQKWLYSNKSGCIRAKVVVVVRIGCIRTKWLHSDKVVVFGQKLLYLAKMVKFGPSGCISVK